MTKGKNQKTTKQQSTPFQLSNHNKTLIIIAVPMENKETGAVDELKSDYSKLSSLDGLNSVLIKQPIRNKEILREMFCGCEMENLYAIQSVNEQKRQVTQLFTLKEESNCCLRQWY